MDQTLWNCLNQVRELMLCGKLDCEARIFGGPLLMGGLTSPNPRLRCESPRQGIFAAGAFPNNRKAAVAAREQLLLA